MVYELDDRLLNMPWYVSSYCWSKSQSVFSDKGVLLAVVTNAKQWNFQDLFTMSWDLWKSKLLLTWEITKVHFLKNEIEN